jgi:tetratricopeptide (TPR) repeat protein
LLLSIDRRDIINDDLGAITTVPRKLGRGSGLKINDVFWTTFLNNSTFFTAARNNYLAGAATALGIDGLTAAEDSWQEALASWGRLAAEFPARPAYRQGLAASHNNLAILFSHSGRLAEAEAAYRDALTLQKQLAADFPNQPDMQNDLAGTLVNLASLCNQQRDYAAAKAYLEEARPFHLAALKANPKHPTYRQSYRNNLANLTQAHAGLLDQVPAIKTAEQIRDLGSDAAGNVYDAACALALCIPIVEKHEKLDAKERQAAVQFYGDEAMKLLRDAVSKGFRDAAQMKKDTDLAPLRERADFQKLLADLEAKPELRAGKEAKPK